MNNQMPMIFPNDMTNIEMRLNALESEVNRLERRVAIIEKNLMPYNKTIPSGNNNYTNDNYMI